jgi:hypothetical protein
MAANPMPRLGFLSVAVSADFKRIAIQCGPMVRHWPYIHRRQAVAERVQHTSCGPYVPPLISRKRVAMTS